MNHLNIVFSFIYLFIYLFISSPLLPTHVGVEGLVGIKTCSCTKRYSYYFWNRVV